MCWLPLGEVHAGAELAVMDCELDTVVAVDEAEDQELDKVADQECLVQDDGDAAAGSEHDGEAEE